MLKKANKISDSTPVCAATIDRMIRSFAIELSDLGARKMYKKIVFTMIDRFGELDPQRKQDWADYHGRDYPSDLPHMVDELVAVGLPEKVGRAMCRVTEKSYLEAIVCQ